MTNAQQRHVKMKKRFRKNVKRMVRTILLAPGKLPRIRFQVLEHAIRACEVSGITFVVALLTCLLRPDRVNVVLSMASAAVFFGLLLVIKLEQYQEILDKQEFS